MEGMGAPGGFGVDDLEACAEDVDGALLEALEFVRLLQAVDVFLYRSTNEDIVPGSARDLQSSTAVTNRGEHFMLNFVSWVTLLTEDFSGKLS
jgi:hypothetical protein